MSHALLPSFVLVRRLDEAGVIVGVLVGVVAGKGVRPLALASGVPYETARGWRRRYRARAPTLTAGLAAWALGLGGVAPKLRGGPERCGLEALVAAWRQARRRLGKRMAGLSSFASLVTGGELLGTTTSPPWAGLGGRDLMPPTPSTPT